MSTAMHEMQIARLAEAARRMMADSGLNPATVAIRVHVDGDRTRVVYSASVGEYNSAVHEVGDSLDELVEVITPQLVELKDQRSRKVRDLHTTAKELGFTVVPVGTVVSPPINWNGSMVSTTTYPGVAFLEGGE